MEKVYVQAVMELLSTGSDIEQVLGNLRVVMNERGHGKALSAVLRDVVRTLEQESATDVPLVTVARDTDVAALASDIKTALVLQVSMPPLLTILLLAELLQRIIIVKLIRVTEQNYRTFTNQSPINH
jgi:hypothetical protein